MSRKSIPKLWFILGILCMFFGEVDKYRGICYTIGIMGVEYNGKGKGGENMKCFKKINRLVLGCTHYPLFELLIRKELSKKVDIINTGEKVANYLQEYLFNKKIENNKKEKGFTIYLTDKETNFSNVASKLLEQEVEIQEAEF